MKKTVALISFVLVGLLAWYLFIKPYDYLVTFKVKTTAGTINQSLKIWNRSLENENPLEQEDLYNLVQKISFHEDSIATYKWTSHLINDSLTKVKVYVKDIHHSFQNKIAVPFSTTDFERRTKKTVKDFVKELQEHLKKIKVQVVGESKTPLTYCAYVPVKGVQISKARGMMQYYSEISGVLINNNIKFNGTPFLEITDWNMKNDSIAYNFCFPIVKKDSLPNHEFIQFKQTKSVKALKAIYNGNYITSDRAWYRLLEYAKQNDIKVSKTPVEVFYNNPNFGGDALRWKAEIYMPIKEN